MTNNNSSSTPNTKENIVVGSGAFVRGSDWAITTAEEMAELIASTEAERNRPIYKSRYGRVNLAIWQQQKQQTEGSTDRIRYAARLTRTYKTADGVLKDTASLDAEDLPTATTLLLTAQQWIMNQQAQQAAERRATASTKGAAVAETEPHF